MPARWSTWGRPVSESAFATAARCSGGSCAASLIRPPVSTSTNSAGRHTHQSPPNPCYDHANIPALHTCCRQCYTAQAPCAWCNDSSSPTGQLSLHEQHGVSADNPSQATRMLRAAACAGPEGLCTTAQGFLPGPVSLRQWPPTHDLLYRYHNTSTRVSGFRTCDSATDLWRPRRRACTAGRA